MANASPEVAGVGTSARRIVFISHANPEQNDFTRWLGAQLANAGYEVWSDVTKLIGGEVFWDDIEDAIRNHAAKFVLAVSRAASQKDGVQDEVAVAVAVERGLKIKNFVIPCRIDDLEFSSFRANITRKNAIDFSKGWAAGLAQLLKVLERDKVPSGRVSAADVNAWCERRFDPAQQPKRDNSETLVSNWLSVAKLPSHVSFFDLGTDANRTRELMQAARVPWFPYYRLVGTFASEPDLRQDLPPELTIKREYHVPLDVFLRGKPPELPGMEARVARNHISSMLRQAWDRTLAARGLTAFQMAGGAPAWYFKRGQIEGDKAYFIDHTGKRRRRQVVGRSERRKVYWHLGYRAKANVGQHTRFSLRPVILFSEDGTTPLSSTERMHRLRRSFCRSWWNQHWRDLFLTYVSWLAEGTGEIALAIGDFASVRIDARPLMFTSPLSCPDPAVKAQTPVPAEDDEEELPDEGDDAEDDFGDEDPETPGDEGGNDE
jgi:hypothetical protein